MLMDSQMKAFAAHSAGQSYVANISHVDIEPCASLSSSAPSEDGKRIGDNGGGGEEEEESGSASNSSDSSSSSSSTAGVGGGNACIKSGYMRGDASWVVKVR
jgi:hypothetical protein